ncbi:MAG: GIY-YIG nuclease family protein [Eubacteriales bacterium]
MYYVYILKCRDDSLYTGITTNLPQRLAQHRDGTGAKYTRGKSPLTLVYVSESENRSTASKEEARIKKLKKEDKQALIAQGNQKLLKEMSEKK